MENNDIVKNSTLKEIVKNSKLATAGGYYYKALLIDPVPAVIVWTQDNIIEVYELTSGEDTHLIRTADVSDITYVSSDQGTLSIKFKKEPMLNLLLDEPYRDRIVASTDGNIMRNFMNGSLRNTALDMTPLATDNQFLSTENKKYYANINQWTELLRKVGIHNKHSLKANGTILKILIAIVILLIMMYIALRFLV